MSSNATQHQVGVNLVAPIEEEPSAVRPTTEGGEAHDEERLVSIPTSMEMLATIDVLIAMEMLAATDAPSALKTPAAVDVTVTSMVEEARIAGGIGNSYAYGIGNVLGGGTSEARTQRFCAAIWAPKEVTFEAYH